jgi:hypothetical protein
MSFYLLPPIYPPGSDFSMGDAKPLRKKNNTAAELGK